MKIVMSFYNKLKITLKVFDASFLQKSKLMKKSIVYIRMMDCHKKQENNQLQSKIYFRQKTNCIYHLKIRSYFFRQPKMQVQKSKILLMMTKMNNMMKIFNSTQIIIKK